MKAQRTLVVLTVANLILLVFLLAQTLIPSAEAQSGALLRGRGLEIVDAAGRVRASIGVLAPQTLANGTGSTETVLFRLINSEGQPSVKIVTTETGSSLSFVGGDDLSYVVLSAEGADAVLKMVEPNGRQQIVTP